MLKSRVLTAVVTAPVHLAITIWGRPVHFAIYVTLLATLSLLEMFNLFEKVGIRVHRLVTLAAAATFVAAVAFRPYVAACAVVFLILAVLVVPLCRRGPAGAMRDGAGSLFAFGYVAVLFSFLVLIRVRPAGVQLLLVLFLTIWIMDIAAYFCGRRIGKRRLAPAISPGKTVAGAVAGAVAAFVSAPLLSALAFPKTGLGWVGGLAAAAVITGGDIVGDLAESALKRDAGVKDSGAILPGHGGILDRFDAVIFCAPMFYAVAVFLARP